MSRRPGVSLGRKGEIVVDEYSRTSASNIYAIGDVTDRVQLTPVAIHEAMCLRQDRVRGQAEPRPITRHVPSAVFTTPEIASIGMSEMKALGLGHAIDVYKSTFKPLKHTMTGSEERSHFKLIVDARTQTVLGCHIFGWGAAEIVQMTAVAMRMGAKKSDFDATIALHPTAAEELVTMRTKSYSKEA